eukprot:IDg5783t1
MARAHCTDQLIIPSPFIVLALDRVMTLHFTALTEDCMTNSLTVSWKIISLVRHGTRMPVSSPCHDTISHCPDAEP